MAQQHVFFVATASSEADGHVNLSPKGLDAFRVLDPRRVAYLDYTGSGVETIAHVRQNGRLTIMFCAFEGPPRIVRLHGRGEVVEPSSPAFSALLTHFEAAAGLRSIIVSQLDRVSDSCGFGVPLLAYQGERKQMGAWVAAQGEDGLAAYRAEHNVSIDGLPGLGAIGAAPRGAAPG